MKTINKLIFLIFPIILTGCAGMKSSFDCNVASGGKCAPMTSINEMANRGMFQRTSLKSERAIDYNKYSSGANYANSDNLPLRINESVQQIWIAPYEDASGIYHDAASIYVVAQKGRWTGKPPIVIAEDE
jgi:hypothetical protein